MMNIRNAENTPVAKFNDPQKLFDTEKTKIKRYWKQSDENASDWEPNMPLKAAQEFRRDRLMKLIDLTNQLNDPPEACILHLPGNTR